ncbi:MAG: lysophospholipid acyltransferase family protein [Fimbriimonadaceae bacterium]
MKKLGQRLGTWAFVGAQQAVLRMTDERAERFGAGLGRLLMRFSRKHRERALSNLALAFPEWDLGTRETTARRCFEHFGIVAADFVRAPLRTVEDYLRTPMAGIEHLADAERAGRGALCVTGHLGNWERGAGLVAARGYLLTVIARDANDADLNQKVNQLRALVGSSVISRGSAARSALAVLRKNGRVALLPDQNSEEIFVPFFGQPCGTTQGPAVLSQRTGAPILTVGCYRVGPCRYEGIIDGPVIPEPGYELPEAMTRAVNARLEAMIRQYPEQWLWFHDRWKSARRRGLLDSSS